MRINEAQAVEISRTLQISLPTRTTDGILLSELGCGLSDEKAVDCEECNHHGYNFEEIFGVLPCEKCGGTGSVSREFECRECNGTGKFTQKHTQKVVSCKKCKGTGKFEHPRLKNRCSSCHGTGKNKKAVVGIKAEKCHECHGKGQTLPFNPVIPKEMAELLKSKLSKS